MNSLLTFLFAALPFHLRVTNQCAAPRTEVRRVCEENTHGWAGCAAGFLWGGPVGCAAGAIVGSSADTGKCYDKETTRCDAYFLAHVPNGAFVVGLP